MPKIPSSPSTFIENAGDDGADDSFGHLGKPSLGFDRVSSDFKDLVTKLVQVYEQDVKKAGEGRLLLDAGVHTPKVRIDVPKIVSAEEPMDIFKSASSATLAMRRISFMGQEDSDFKFVLRKEWTGEKGRKLITHSVSQAPHTMDQMLAELVGKCEAAAPSDHVVGSSRCVLHPGSYKRIAWDITSGLCLFWDWITIPFIVGFDPPVDGVLFVLTLFTAVFWTLDMLLSCLTGYSVNKNEVVMQPRRILLNYLRTHFVLDVFLVTIDWILLIGETGKQGSAARLGRSVRFLKLLKTLKLLRTMVFKKYIRAMQDMLQSESSTVWFSIFRSVTFILLLNHSIACIWFFIGVKSKNGWVDDAVKGHTLGYQYVSSLHWSLAQFTPAPNEIFPSNFSERLFAVLVLVTAMVTFSSFTASITAGVLQIRKLRKQEESEFWQVRRYLRQWGIPLKFRKRVLTYLEYAYAKQRTKVQEKDVSLLSLLSEQLQKELRKMTLKEHLYDHPLFYRLRSSTLVFINSLSIRSLAMGDTPIRYAEEGSEMFILTAGHMTYLKPVEGLGTTTHNIHYGDWFCEPVLWTPHWIHFGTIVAEHGCQAITITGKDFGKLVQRNVDLWSKVHPYGVCFIDELNRIDRAELSDLKDMMANFDYNEVLNACLLANSLRAASDSGPNLGAAGALLLHLPRCLADCFTSHLSKMRTPSDGARPSR